MTQDMKRRDGNHMLSLLLLLVLIAGLAGMKDLLLVLIAGLSGGTAGRFSSLGIG